MRPEAVDHLRTHHRAFAARWAKQVADMANASVWWRDPERVDPHMLAGADALARAAATGRAEPFTQFVVRLCHEVFALHVPLAEVIRALLIVRPIVLDELSQDSGSPGTDPETAQFASAMVSLGILEAIRHHQRQIERQTRSLQEQIEEFRDRLRRQALVDPVTGLFNADYFAAAARREVLRSRRPRRTCVIGLIALDDDPHNEVTPEDADLQTVSAQIADVLTRGTRQVDVRASLGGGRFGVVLPETSLDAAFLVAERLRRAVEETAFPLPGHVVPRTYTVSIGLASYPRDGDDEQILLARAEEALARARAGRNTTVAAAAAIDL